MKIPKISGYVNKLASILPRADAEKLVLKALIAIWVVVLLAVVGLQVVKGTYEDPEKKILNAATKTRRSSFVTWDEIKKYESILVKAEYPEPESEYAQKVRRDPFSEYNEKAANTPIIHAAERDFALQSVGNIPLPIKYQGYIELPDKVIGQIKWKESTRFVEPGASLNGYVIQRVTKSKIEVVDEQGKGMEFLLNKPVLSDKLYAVLYDRISRKNFSIEIASVIDGYKVIDIQPDYVILFSNGSEMKLTKE